MFYDKSERETIAQMAATLLCNSQKGADVDSYNHWAVQKAIAIYDETVRQLHQHTCVGIQPKK